MLARNQLSREHETTVSDRGVLLVHDRTAGFAEKRQFRAYREFSTAQTLRFTATKPFILTSQLLWTGQGAAQVRITTGGTPSGTWTPIPTKFCKWLLDGPVNGFTTFDTGGTVTGGTEREVLKSDSSAAGGGSGNTSPLTGERALPAGTYYMTITIDGTTDGVYSLEWEEFP